MSKTHRPVRPLTDYPRVERALLARSHRGMERVASQLPADFCARAAKAAWEHRERALVLTGFWIASAGKPENDGPPGALLLARGLARCGSEVSFVSEPATLGILRGMAAEMWSGPQPGFVEFPPLDVTESAARAEEIAEAVRPTLVISVERCGPDAGGAYRNVRGHDISHETARLDLLMSVQGAVSVGIGDGGNELGMGVVAEYLSEVQGLASPCVTPADHLVVATVSNWAAYGLLAYLEELSGEPLLPSPEEAARAVRLSVEHGAVHAITGKAEQWVDGFPPELEEEILLALARRGG